MKHALLFILFLVCVGSAIAGDHVVVGGGYGRVGKAVIPEDHRAFSSVDVIVKAPDGQGDILYRFYIIHRSAATTRESQDLFAMLSYGTFTGSTAQGCVVYVNLALVDDLLDVRVFSGHYGPKRHVVRECELRLPKASRPNVEAAGIDFSIIYKELRSEGSDGVRLPKSH